MLQWLPHARALFAAQPGANRQRSCRHIGQTRNGSEKLSSIIIWGADLTFTEFSSN